MRFIGALAIAKAEEPRNVPFDRRPDPVHAAGFFLASWLQAQAGPIRLGPFPVAGRDQRFG